MVLFPIYESMGFVSKYFPLVPTTLHDAIILHKNVSHGLVNFCQRRRILVEDLLPSDIVWADGFSGGVMRLGH